MEYLVLDTNILLLDANNLITLGKNGTTIVLPEIVLDEIDSKKSGHSEIAFQAREFGRLLTRATKVSTTSVDNMTIVTRGLDGVIIKIVSILEYPSYADTETNIINDRKIIQVALEYKKVLKLPTVFMTNDVMCGIRAEALGLDVIDLKNIEFTEMKFTKELEVDATIFSKLHNTHIDKIDSEYLPENYNYIFSNSVTGETKLGIINNGIIDIISKEAENQLAKQDATPMNSGQRFMSKAIQSPYIDIVVCEALAGSGKTVTALSNAVQLVKRGSHSNIIYVRASVTDVDKAEEIGFLSGNDEKIQVYLHPLDDTIDFLVRQNYKDSKLKGKEYEDMIAEKIAEYRSKYRITGLIGLGMRGRTFTDTVAIIDECQNMSKASLQKVLTRFGKGCKIILIGSNKQIDNSYITKYTNGLSIVLAACKEASSSVKLHAVPLTQVLRSNIAEWAEKIFSKG